jgi:2-polyprenyl-3-methyl-5-hydroxy-6-metoxy-1,4-benzoquinol methylase
MSKLRYLSEAVRKQRDPRYAVCQNCGASAGTIVSRKYLVTALRRCAGCSLMIRVPVDLPDESARFYQSDYSQDTTTAMPGPAELAALVARDFAGTERAYGRYLALLDALGIRRGARLFDFGCSWGYGSFQLARAGFEVDAFEISAPRRAFAVEKLGVRAADRFPPPGPVPTYDVFFSAHVLEHVPAPGEVLRQALAMVRPGGLVVSVVPNGTARFRREHPRAWQRLWGKVHPNLIDDHFVEQAFPAVPRLFSTLLPEGPTTEQRAALGAFGRGEAAADVLADSYELVIVLRRPG